MKADLTRDSHDPLQNYSQVLMQQGRVQLDADWNEQGSILVHQLRAAIADLVGPVGGRAAVGWPAVPGFGLLPLPDAAPPDADFVIANGRYYVDGVLCELAAEVVTVVLAEDRKSVLLPRWRVDGRSFAVGQLVRIWSGDPADDGTIAKVTAADYANLTLALDPVPAGGDGRTQYRLLQRVTTYRTQPGFAGPLPELPTTGTALAYLDVFERLVTSLEDPAIREVALGSAGPDTAARVQTIAQVRLLPGVEACLSPGEIAAKLAPGPRGLLRARALPATGATDPCTIDPDAGYRGPENQLYRVEIHQGGREQPSFKWSRENGSVLFQVQSLAAGIGTVTLTLAGLGRDDRFGLAEGDLVELQSEWTALATDDPPTPLLTVKSIDRDTRRLTLSLPTGAAFDSTRYAAPLNPLLRRWDHKGAELGPDNALPIPLDAAHGGKDWLGLEDGVQVQFALLPEVNYRPGDYWLIPARVATGTVIWPQDRWTDAQNAVRAGPALRPPDGIRHRYAPLAVVSFSGDAAPTIGEDSCQIVLGVRPNP